MAGWRLAITPREPGTRGRAPSAAAPRSPSGRLLGRFYESRAHAHHAESENSSPWAVRLSVPKRLWRR